jgi:ABC-type amino acid transport substrate-binding protein
MRNWLATSGAAALLVTMAAMTAARADDILKICLDENLPPLSVHHRGAPDRGFDVTLAQAVAERLGRSFKIQWFESKLDEDSSPALEANALLSDGRCSLVGGYALTKDSLVVPGVIRDGRARGTRAP